MTPLELFIATLSLISILIICFNTLRSNGRRHLRLPPGPKPLPIVGNLPHLGPVPHHSLAAMFKIYGPLVHLRLGSVHVVAVGSSSVAQQFLKTHDANFSSRPPNSGAKHMAYNYQDLVFAPYGARWRMFRKICSVHLFSVKALDDFRYVRHEEVAILVNALAAAGESTSGPPDRADSAGRGHGPTSSSTASSVINLGQMLNVCTTNALGRVMLGKRVFGECGAGVTQKELKSEEFKEMVVELMVLAGVFNIGDFIPWLNWFDLQGVAKKMKKLHTRFDDFLNNIIEEHKNMDDSDSENKRDLLSKLLELKEVGVVENEQHQQQINGGSGVRDKVAQSIGMKLTDTDIKALLLDLFTAGTDTSSSTVEWAIAELIRHPNILNRAQQELDSVVGKDRLVAESDLPQLPYLQSIIKETFRLHPSTPLSLPRIAQESCEINGYHIPKNSTLLVNVWAIARDSQVWPNPLEFRPERFLPDGVASLIDIKGNDFEVIPFGAGRRICAGMSLGLRMVQFMTATLVHAFDWELPEGQVLEKLNMEEAYGLTLQRAEPLMVHPRPRLPFNAYPAGIKS